MSAERAIEEAASAVRNGLHDLGGVPGYGAVTPERGDPPAYPEGWEGRCIGLIIGTMARGLYGVDEWRMAMEGLPPAAQLSMGYYRRWAHALETCLLAHDVVGREELGRRALAVAAGAEEPNAGLRDPEFLDLVVGLLRDGGSLVRELPDPPRFAVGAAVRTRAIHVPVPGRSHTRLPGYAQGRTGVVELVHPPMALPDAAAEGEERTDHLYAVSFAADELWSDGDPTVRVSADLFESYLLPDEEHRVHE